MQNHPDVRDLRTANTRQKARLEPQSMQYSICINPSKAEADSDNLPAPSVIAQEIVEDLQAALEQFKLIAGDMGADVMEEA
ncbi:MAG TPA: hypothetical protein VFY22_00425 [Hydrogenophaga sp.]|nr:hypothetical protein [Hydrogenophaga sp.]